MNTVNVECVEQTVNVECVKNTYEISSPVAGPRGKKGKPGPPGEPGPPNTLTIGTVDTGEAAATITGQSPNQVLNLTLPEGGGGGGGGLEQITVGSVTELEFAQIVKTDGAEPWISGTVAGYLTMTDAGFPGVMYEIPDRGGGALILASKSAVVRYVDPPGYAFETLSILLIVGASGDIGLPGPNRWVLLVALNGGTGGIPLGDHVQISLVG